ncbi:hypothetical protein [Gracilimonas sp.]|uniref:hypothetical protein n=1 Tax=Gracilimonas sp. TaxID=1974203 RepID=UPI0032EF46EA
MNRVIKRQHSSTIENFERISEYENDVDLKSEIESGLSSIFLISNKIPLRDVYDFFSGENFSVLESFEELEASYHLAKYGFYKQSMVSLRIALDIGLLSIFWSIIGIESNRFKEWYSSKSDTPRKDKNFWQTLNSNDSISKFNEKFDLKEEIESLGALSDFVHTKGLWYSNFSDVKRKIKGQDEFKDFKIWFGNFKKVIRILEILHLLKYPTMCLDYSTEFLLSKFGTLDKIPQFGGGLGDEKKYVFSFLSKKEKQLIEELSNENEEVQNIKKYISELPDLSEKEIRTLVFKEQKKNIGNSGFDNWSQYSHVYDHRIDDEMKNDLKEWAQKNNLMSIDDIIKNHQS